MKVTFTRDHVNNKKGDTVELPEERANYLLRMGAVTTDEKLSIDPAKEKVEFVDDKTGEKTSDNNADKKPGFLSRMFK